MVAAVTQLAQSTNGPARARPKLGAIGQKPRRFAAAVRRAAYARQAATFLNLPLPCVALPASFLRQRSARARPARTLLPSLRRSGAVLELIVRARMPATVTNSLRRAAVANLADHHVARHVWPTPCSLLSLDVQWIDMQPYGCHIESCMDLVFRALADEADGLLDSLSARSAQTLNELCSGLSMTRQAVSKHLVILEEANLVATVNGREKLHYLNPVPIAEIASGGSRNSNATRSTPSWI